MQTLEQALNTVTQRNRWRFHFPSHAGTLQAEINLKWDQTELPELDVLGDPSGVLLKSQEQCAELFGSAQCFYLINGASVGLMAALLALDAQDGPVLIARNAHRSVVHGLILAGLQPVWMLPSENIDWGVWGEVHLEALKEQYVNHPKAQAVVLTHPTYEGIESNIIDIANWCHENNLKLIVDEAHGALWPLANNLPVSAIASEADIVIHSLHKSAGALTQCALLHMGQNSKISPSRLQQALNLLQTTSPSYLLLSNIESTCQHWKSLSGQAQIEHHIKRCLVLKQFIRSLNNIACLSPASSSFQLLIMHKQLSAETFATLLEEEHHIAFESLNEKSVFLHLNIGLPDEAFAALQQALLVLDNINEASLKMHDEVIQYQFELPKISCSPRDAFFSHGELILKSQSVGRISRQLVATCPPGIPVLIPGEIITTCHLDFLPDEVDVVMN